MVRGVSEGADPFGTARLRRGVLDAWVASPARFREDANAEEDLVLGGYRDRLIVELAQNAADAAARAGVPGRLRLALHPAEGDDPAVLAAANTGVPLDAAGVESLSTLRASAKRDEESPAGAASDHPASDRPASDHPAPASSGLNSSGLDSGGMVGRFGVGFSAVLAVSDEPAVVSRTGGLRWSLSEARELTRQAAAGTPGLADELRRRDGHVPLLRLPLPAEGTAPVGYDTAVVLPLRDGAAEDLVTRLLAGIDDALLLTLPGLTEVVIDTPEGVRTLTRRQDGPYVLIEQRAGDTSGTSGAAGAAGEADAPSGAAPAQVTRWRVSRAGGRIDATLRVGRAVEERLRPIWSVTWAVPVAADGA
ncbi:hypothetical protein QMK28_32445, partial [Streptomyces sp. H27-D2]|nr:hypothetical protein [Streptomyces sp. H27-D2]